MKICNNNNHLLTHRELIDEGICLEVCDLCYFPARCDGSHHRDDEGGEEFESIEYDKKDIQNILTVIKGDMIADPPEGMDELYMRELLTIEERDRSKKDPQLDSEINLMAHHSGGRSDSDMVGRVQ